MKKKENLNFKDSYQIHFDLHFSKTEKEKIIDISQRLISEFSDKLDIYEIKYEDYEKYIIHILFLLVRSFSKMIIDCDEKRFQGELCMALCKMVPYFDELVEDVMNVGFIDSEEKAAALEAEFENCQFILTRKCFGL
jgi:hypothetical protein